MPSVRCSSGPRPARRTRSNSAPAAEREREQDDRRAERVGDRDHDRAPVAALTEITAARIGPAQGV